MVVHAHGRITVRDDEAFLRGLVARLTRKMEAGEPAPWKMGDAPADYLSQMLAAIVGIEIEVTRLVGKWKLGQNKAAEDRRGAAEALLARQGDEQRAVGQAMLTRRRGSERTAAAWGPRRHFNAPQFNPASP